MSSQQAAIDRIHDHVFNLIYSKSLVYNTCWEDPAVDRQALELGPDDTMLVITSAGCNVLDYVLTAPKHIHAVDMNPRQNALLELKIAGIRGLGYGDFFQVFGTGHHPDICSLYRYQLRPFLRGYAREYWDDKYIWFKPSSRMGGFYFRGLSGKVARSFHWYLCMVPGLRREIERLLSCTRLDEQREVYLSTVQPYLWGKHMNWLLSRQFTMNMLGVPHPQRKEVEDQHENGVAGFIRESIEYVFQQIPLSINYFWRLYLEGCYSAECCPEYLKKENFYRLKYDLVDRISITTDSVTRFLNNTPGKISRFVLLDHMDWMSSYRDEDLVAEWQAIFSRATDDARVIFRSAHATPAYLENLLIPGEAGDSFNLAERLRFYPVKAKQLQQQDRVHTYAGFHIADVLA